MGFNFLCKSPRMEFDVVRVKGFVIDNNFNELINCVDLELYEHENKKRHDYYSTSLRGRERGRGVIVIVETENLKALPVPLNLKKEYPLTEKNAFKIEEKKNKLLLI